MCSFDVGAGGGGALYGVDYLPVGDHLPAGEAGAGVRDRRDPGDVHHH